MLEDSRGEEIQAVHAERANSEWPFYLTGGREGTSKERHEVETASRKWKLSCKCLYKTLYSSCLPRLKEEVGFSYFATVLSRVTGKLEQGLLWKRVCATHSLSVARGSLYHVQAGSVCADYFLPTQMLRASCLFYAWKADLFCGLDSKQWISFFLLHSISWKKYIKHSSSEFI